MAGPVTRLGHQLDNEPHVWRPESIHVGQNLRHGILEPVDQVINCGKRQRPELGLTFGCSFRRLPHRASPVRVILADDRWVVRQGLRISSSAIEFSIVGEAEDGATASGWPLSTSRRGPHGLVDACARMKPPAA